MSTSKLPNTIIETRGDSGALLLAPELAPEEWHLRIDTEIIADVLLDKAVHNSYMIKIEDPNMRDVCYSEGLAN